MTTVEMGRGKSGRRAYPVDEIGIVPSRRTRDPEEVSVAWQIDAYRFEMPLVASPMDSVVSPAFAARLGAVGGLAVLDLEGLWTRFEDPEPILAEIAELPQEAATRRLQLIYHEPIKEELIGQRIEEIRSAGVTTAARLSPQRTVRYYKTVVDAGADIFVIRGPTVSAEHVSGQAEPLNLKQFIYELDVPVIVGGCATYTAALHLMRTGAAGVLVGFGGGSGQTTAAVLGGKAPIAKAAEAPGCGYHWGAEAHHPELPRGDRLKVGTIGTLEQILHGPSTVADGSMNLMGALRRTMATSGYSDLKEFQRVEVVVTPSAAPSTGHGTGRG